MDASTTGSRTSAVRQIGSGSDTINLVILDWVVFELNDELQLVRVRHVQAISLLRRKGRDRHQNPISTDHIDRSGDAFRTGGSSPIWTRIHQCPDSRVTITYPRSLSNMKVRSVQYGT